MRTSTTATLDFSLSDAQAQALKRPEHRAARGDLATLARDNAYRPWNQRFEDPATPLDLPRH